MMQKKAVGLSLLQELIKSAPVAKAEYFREIFFKLNKVSRKTYYNRLVSSQISDLALWFHISGVGMSKDNPEEINLTIKHYQESFRNVPTWEQSTTNFQTSIL